MNITWKLDQHLGIYSFVSELGKDPVYVHELLEMESDELLDDEFNVSEENAMSEEVEVLPPQLFFRLI